MSQPYLHFTRDEFNDRQNRVCKALGESNLDGLLLFRIEDMYWLTGLDTDGFYVFHCMYVGTDGALTYIARRVDRGNVLYSSIIEDYREWLDDLDTPPSRTIKDMLASHEMQGKRIGLQRDSMGLTAERYVELTETLEGWCELVPCSELVSNLRMVKSPTELAYLRKSGEITDKICNVAIEETRSGVFEGEVFGRILQTIYENDGDPPALRNPMGSGDSAPLGRYVTGRREVAQNDQFKFELGCGYRHYHTANLFYVLTGPKVNSAYHRLYEAASEAIKEVQMTARAGNTVGDLFESHRRVYAEYALEEGILFSCGYQMGISFPPTWVGWPMIIASQPLVLEAGMTFFTHVVSRAEGVAFGLGEQFIVTEGQPEIITHVPRELIVKD